MRGHSLLAPTITHILTARRRSRRVARLLYNLYLTMKTDQHLHRSLEQEAEALGHYLIGGPIPGELTARYAEAESMIGDRSQTGPDRRLLDFGVRRPWSIAPLDAACALLRPQAMLRDKLLRLAGILEASPAGAQDFLPESRGPLGTLVCLASIAVSSVIQLVVGAALLKAIEVHAGIAENRR